MNKANVFIQIISILLIATSLYFLFSMNIFSIIIFIVGLLSTYFLIKAYGKESRENPFYFAFAGIGAFLTYFFFNNILFIGTFLLGANIIAFFLFTNDDTRIKKGIQIMNVTALSGLILESGIRKFRGFNKLEFDDIQITILLIVLITFAVYFLVQILKLLFKNKKNIGNYLVVLSVILTALGYYALTYFFYQEVGLSKIYIPLLYGLTVAVVDYFFKGRNIIKDFLQLTLLFVSPYVLSGILGIFLSFLSAYLFKYIIGNHICIKDSTNAHNKKQGITTISESTHLSILDSTSQLLFLFGAIEVQENLGIIMRFNLAAGFQTGWILVSVILYEYGLQFYKWGKDLLEKYAMTPVLSIVTTLFAILFIAGIIKVGHKEALASLLIASSIYLLLVDLIVKDTRNKLFVTFLSNVVGVMAFMMLAVT